MENTMCGARADFQTAGLNGVFAHFCRRGQKWVAPEREASPCRLLKEMGPPEGAIRAPPVADKARRASGRGQNFKRPPLGSAEILGTATVQKEAPRAGARNNSLVQKLFTLLVKESQK